METDVREMKRTELLGIPVDSGGSEQCLRDVERLFATRRATVAARSESPLAQHIAFLSLLGLLNARRNHESHRYFGTATLVLPVTRLLATGARILGRPRLSVFRPFDFVIRLLSLAEKHRQSVYLFGSRKGDLERAERNLRVSFPNLILVGRFSGYFPESRADDIVRAIRKASPALLLIGSGVPGRALWGLRNSNNLNPGLSLWVDDYFEICAGRKKNNRRVSLNSVIEVITKPWRIVRVFSFLYYFLLILIHRLRGW